MARVYLEAGRNGRKIAIKVPVSWAGDGSEQRFIRREAKVLARFRHPNIVEYYGSGKTQDGIPFIALEYVEEGSVEKRNRLPLPLPKALEVTRDIAKALEYIHSQDWCHVDVKLENILMSRDGKLVKLCDFSHAVPVGTWGMGWGPTGDGRVIVPYTPEFSPFSARNADGILKPPNKSGDINALGLSLFQMATEIIALPMRRSRSQRTIYHEEIAKNYCLFHQMLTSALCPPSLNNPSLRELLCKMTGFFGEEKIPAASEVITVIDQLLVTEFGSR
jgi:serine/threonine protein kinase